MTGIKIKSEENCIISMQIRKTRTVFFFYLKVNLLFYLIYQFPELGFRPFLRIVRRKMNDCRALRRFKQIYFRRI